MELGERIKKRRFPLRKSSFFCIIRDKCNDRLVSVSTVYRYEDSSIEKIPVHVFDSLCRILQTTPTRLMGNEVDEDTILPENFGSPQEAMEFILKLPTLAAYGGYDLDKLDDRKIMEFANEILQQLKLVSYKYK